MKTIPVLLTLLAFPTILVAPAMAQDSHRPIDEGQARSLLKQIESRFLDTRPFSVRFETRYRLAEGEVGEYASKAENSRGEIRFDRDRLEVIRRDEKLDESSGEFVAVREEHFVWQDGRRIGLRRFVRDGVSEQPFTMKAKFHDAVRPDMIGWFADGIVIGSEHFSTTLLAGRSLQALREAVGDGERLVHFTAATPYGDFEVWVAADEAPLLRRVKFVAGPEYMAQFDDLDGVSITVEVAGYESVEGGTFPTIAQAVYSYQIPGVGTIDKAISVERADYELSPDWVALNAFQPQLADGTNVSDYDEGGVRHVWRDGKLSRLP